MSYHLMKTDTTPARDLLPEVADEFPVPSWNHCEKWAPISKDAIEEGCQGCPVFFPGTSWWRETTYQCRQNRVEILAFWYPSYLSLCQIFHTYSSLMMTIPWQTFQVWGDYTGGDVVTSFPSSIIWWEPYLNARIPLSWSSCPESRNFCSFTRARNLLLWVHLAGNIEVVVFFQHYINRLPWHGFWWSK